MPIDTIIILSLSANNVRTDGSIGKGKALIDVTNRSDASIAVPFASDAKSLTPLQCNERNS